MSIENILFRSQVTATGGRDGNASSADGNFKVQLSTPRELGGAGGNGSNPEQLFAAGYAACFLSALKYVAAQEKIRLPDASNVTGIVGIGAIPGGFGIEVELQIDLPTLPREQAQSLVERAHLVCPYSNATRNNIDVRLTVL